MLIFIFIILSIGKNIRHNLLVGQRNHMDYKGSNNLIRVHLIPHSHDDVGWLKTYEEYYYGLNNRVQWAGIQYTIDSVIRSLFFEGDKRFIQVEIAYFKLWWDDQNDDVKNKTRKLIDNGQLEFINGGWVMNDEATAYYEDVIDQMTLGHQFIFTNFNKTPTVGWQIDPFGHTQAQGKLFYLMGFNGWCFARIDYQDMQIRRNEKQLEFMMGPYPIFTHINYHHYESPPQFSFDTINPSSEAIVDDPNSIYYNVEEKAANFAQYFQHQAESYQTKSLMHTIGSDFAFSNAPMYYKNIDRLIKFINSRKNEFNLEILYSTPTSYFLEISRQDINLTTKQDDFLPYADKPNAYWTGYFTSRPGFKYYIKLLGRQQQILKSFIAQLLFNGKSQYIQVNKEKVLKSFFKLEEALAICQHHDAVTGTAKQFVTNDYERMLSLGQNLVNEEMNQILIELTQYEIPEQQDYQFVYCNQNETQSNCPIFQFLKKQIPIQLNVIDNKYSIFDDVIRIKVPKMNLLIYDQNNNLVIGDIVCQLDDSCDLFFQYKSDPKLTVQYFRIDSQTPDLATAKIIEPKEVSYDIENEITLNNQQSFKLTYQYYVSSEDKQQSSGAYIFRPETQESQEYGSVLKSYTYAGQILSAMSIIRQNIQTLVIQFLSQNDTYEIETFVNEITIDDDEGKELIIKFNSDIKNNGEFFTDSMGMDTQKRKLNHRDTWNLEVTQPVAGNYYPVNGFLYIQDQLTNQSLVVVNDRSQGGTSLREGEIEIMIHRRCLKDDNRGVVEILNEKTPESKKGLSQTFRHTISFYNYEQFPNRHRDLQYVQDTKPIIYFSQVTKEIFVTQPKSFKITYPKDLIKLFLSQKALVKYYFQYLDTNRFLYRIHNIGEIENAEIPKIENYQMIETTLTANQPWTTAQEKRICKKNKLIVLEWKDSAQQLQYDEFLKPQQIRTFLIFKQ